MRQIWGLVLLLICLIPNVVNAQDMIEVAAGDEFFQKIKPVAIVQNEGREIVDIISYGESTNRFPQKSHLLTMYAIRAGYPEGMAVSFGVLVGDIECMHRMCSGTGLILQLEPGLNSIKASGGIAYVDGFGFDVLGLPVGLSMAGIAVKATILRTLGVIDLNPYDLTATYLGVEVELSWLVNVTLGILREAAREDGEADWMFSATVGAGF
ncbi:MAG: hypothetical protein A3K03_12730 [Bdellovibrionales bacterium RIFOXYD1_FULL_44_7]|nr:MAG: hypothetical protein A3K03_12730 [Bdellovibrionales bacterium RIFOXYD1_FULL_44_7]